MSYPRNAASPPIYDVGSLVQISDGALQTSGASARVKIGSGAWGAAAGTLACDATSGIWTYVPSQSETDAESFILGVYKAGCLSISRTIVPSASATAGKASVGSIDTDAITAAAVKADAVTKIQNGLSTYAGGDTAGTTTLLSRLSSTRAGNLDNLDLAISVIQSQITALNNLSAKANWFGALLLEVPDSGTRAYVYELVVKDDEDKLVNLDGSPTIALTNAAGTDRSALITTTIANPATGRYTLTITVGTSTVNESLKLTASGTVSGEARYAVIAPQVVDYDNATQVALLLTRIGAPSVSIAADIATRASQTSVDDLPTNAELATALAASDDATLGAIAAEAVKTTAIQATLAAGVELDPATQTKINKIEAAVAGTVTGAGTSTEVFVGPSATLTITVDSSGNRSNVSVT